MSVKQVLMVVAFVVLVVGTGFGGYRWWMYSQGQREDYSVQIEQNGIESNLSRGGQTNDYAIIANEGVSASARRDGYRTATVNGNIVELNQDGGRVIVTIGVSEVESIQVDFGEENQMVGVGVQAPNSNKREWGIKTVSEIPDLLAIGGAIEVEIFSWIDLTQPCADEACRNRNAVYIAHESDNQMLDKAGMGDATLFPFESLLVVGPVNQLLIK